jgi:hypothetical protein
VAGLFLLSALFVLCGYFSLPKLYPAGGCCIDSLFLASSFASQKISLHFEEERGGEGMSEEVNPEQVSEQTGASSGLLLSVEPLAGGGPLSATAADTTDTDTDMTDASDAATDTDGTDESDSDGSDAEGGGDSDGSDGLLGGDSDNTDTKGAQGDSDGTDVSADSDGSDS